MLIFNGFGTTMPQELLARRYFQARGIDRCIRQPKDLLALCRLWIEQPDYYHQLKDCVQRCKLVGDRDAIRKLLLQGPQSLS